MNYELAQMTFFIGIVIGMSIMHKKYKGTWL